MNASMHDWGEKRSLLLNQLQPQLCFTTVSLHTEVNEDNIYFLNLKYILSYAPSEKAYIIVEIFFFLAIYKITLVEADASKKWPLWRQNGSTLIWIPNAHLETLLKDINQMGHRINYSAKISTHLECLLTFCVILPTNSTVSR